VWHAFGTVPENELKKQSPRVGDLIAAKYFGVREGTEYKAYRIIVEHTNPPANAHDAAAGAADEAEGEAEAPAAADEDDGIPY
jgi:hypothetical protein